MRVTAKFRVHRVYVDVLRLQNSINNTLISSYSYLCSVWGLVGTGSPNPNPQSSHSIDRQSESCNSSHRGGRAGDCRHAGPATLSRSPGPGTFCRTGLRSKESGRWRRDPRGRGAHRPKSQTCRSLIPGTHCRQGL